MAADPVPAYATVEDLVAYLPADVEAGTDAADTERMLLRATEAIDDLVRQPFSIDTQGAPTDETVAEALRDATCGLVEYWCEVGEEHDVAAMGSRQVSLMGFSMSELPPKVNDRVIRPLRRAGLLGQPRTDLPVGCCS